MNRKLPTLIGAAVGLALFLAVALLPSLLYGGYAGVLLVGGIFGASVKATILVRALTWFGMILGVVGVAGLFTVGGAAAGAAVGALARAVLPQPRAQEQEQEQVLEQEPVQEQQQQAA